MSNSKLNIRHLDITDLQRIERFRRAGYGGSVSEALNIASVYAILSSQLDLKPSVRGCNWSAKPCRSNYIPWYRE